MKVDLDLWADTTRVGRATWFLMLLKPLPGQRRRVAIKGVVAFKHLKPGWLEDKTVFVRERMRPESPGAVLAALAGEVPKMLAAVTPDHVDDQMAVCPRTTPPDTEVQVYIEGTVHKVRGALAAH